MNKFWVFEDKSLEIKKLIKEVFIFFAARVMSGGVETLMLFVFVTLAGFDDGVIKIVASVFVIIFNYVVRKFFIFNGEEDKKWSV